MPKSFDQLKILLIQARSSNDILLQEQQCFIERCQIRPNQLSAINVCSVPLPPAIFETYDALMIGGAGEFSATEDYSWTASTLGLIVEAVDHAFPMFGSCWGHQMIARALGGSVIYDKELTEMGCHWIELNEDGRQDMLFRHFPYRFKANMGHHDRVVDLPPSAINLAYSESQSNQAFRLAGKPIYGTQFHSELDAAREEERLYAYRSHYTEVESDEAFMAIIDGLAETTEVDELLHKFLVTYVVCNSTQQH